MPAHAVMNADVGLQPAPPGAPADVTAAFQKALDALAPGQTLYLAAGRYPVSAPLFIRSGTALQGAQDALGHPLATIVQTRRYPVRVIDGFKTKTGVLMNQHYGAASVTDSDITVTAVNFEHESYGTLMRMARNIRVQGCAFQGGQDGTAFLGTVDTVVSDSLVRDTRNAAYDYWNGVRNSTVTHSIAMLAGGYGISFNATDTDGAIRTASDFTATDNIITGAGDNRPAIYVDPLGQGSRITGDVVITGNRISAPQPGARSGGIYISTGDAATVTVKGNIVSDARGYPPILITGYRRQEGHPAPGRPVKVILQGNTITNSSVARAPRARGPVEGGQVIASGNVVRQSTGADGRPLPFLKSNGRVNAWDNQLHGVAPRAYEIPSRNLSLGPPPAGAD
jgi:hypothetical protein